MTGSVHSSLREQTESHLYNPGGKSFGTKLGQLGWGRWGRGSRQPEVGRKKAYLGNEVIKLA